jgi:hypothetical protein
MKVSHGKEERQNEGNGARKKKKRSLTHSCPQVSAAGV